jgi:hypothetical protein
VNSYPAGRYVRVFIAGVIVIACGVAVLIAAITAGGQGIGVLIGLVLTMTAVFRIMAARGLGTTASNLARSVGHGLVVGTVVYGAGVVFFGQPALTLVFGAATTAGAFAGGAVGHRTREKRRERADRGP